LQLHWPIAVHDVLPAFVPSVLQPHGAQVVVPVDEGW